MVADTVLPGMIIIKFEFVAVGISTVDISDIVGIGARICSDGIMVMVAVRVEANTCMVVVGNGLGV